MRLVPRSYRTALLIAAVTVTSGGLNAPATASTFQIVTQLGKSLRETGGVYDVLAADSAGNLYAVAYLRDSSQLGALYLLSAKSSYKRAKMLYNFTTNNNLDYLPSGGVTLTQSNIIMGTTGQGLPDAAGTAFNMGKASHISFGTLHVFYAGTMVPTDGNAPGGLTPGLFDSYYGASVYGGNDTMDNGMTGGDGTLFSVKSSLAKPDYQVLYRFGSTPGDGIQPIYTKLAVDPLGRLYGVTYAGGGNGLGTVYTLQYLNGLWQEQVIYGFAAQHDLNQPTANVVLDAQGNLYGCAEGGPARRGGIFELSPPAQNGGAWSEKVLYYFGTQENDPNAASASPGGGEAGIGCGITINQATKLIVGTSYGGGANGVGTIFELAPPAQGQTDWTETVGYSFGIPQQTGIRPAAAPFELNGVYYGGTTNGLGQIYAFTP